MRYEVGDAGFVVIPPGLLPDGVHAIALPVSDGHALHPDEAAAVQGAVARRRAEFATGRACARRALASLGGGCVPVLVGRARAPLWPAGIVGSISHSRTLAVAVVAGYDAVRAVGIDVEAARPLEPGIRQLLAAPGEGPLPVEPTLADSLRFSCKEAVFKCWFAAGGDRLLEFHEVSLQPAAAGFVAYAPAPGPRRIDGRWALASGHWWSAAWVPILSVAYPAGTGPSGSL